MKSSNIVVVLALLTNAPAAAAFGPRSTSDSSGVGERLRVLADGIGVPGGAVVIVRDGETVLLDAFGVRDSRGGEVTPRTVFRVASVSKVFTATTAAKLIVEGRLSLDSHSRVRIG